MHAGEKAKELGAKVPEDHGINWTWSRGFPSKDAADSFIVWLDANNYEHRGVYSYACPGCALLEFSVRWRS